MSSSLPPPSSSKHHNNTSVATNGTTNHNHNHHNPTSKRYQRLLQAIDKGLAASRRSIDTSACLSDSLGDNVALFGKDSHAILSQWLDSVIEKVHYQVQEGTIHALEQENVPQLLQDVEAICQRLEDEYQTQRQQHQRDQLETQRVLEEHGIVPKGTTSSKSNTTTTTTTMMTPSSEEVVRYHAYQEKLRHKEQLMCQVKEITQKANEWKERHAEMKRNIEEHVQDMTDGLGKEVQQGWESIMSTTTSATTMVLEQREQYGMKRIQQQQ